MRVCACACACVCVCVRARVRGQVNGSTRDAALDVPRVVYALGRLADLVADVPEFLWLAADMRVSPVSD